MIMTIQKIFLHDVAAGGNAEIMEYIFAKYPRDLLGNDLDFFKLHKGMTPLDLATMLGHRQIVEWYDKRLKSGDSSIRFRAQLQRSLDYKNRQPGNVQA